MTDKKLVEEDTKECMSGILTIYSSGFARYHDITSIDDMEEGEYSCKLSETLPTSVNRNTISVILTGNKKSDKDIALTSTVKHKLIYKEVSYDDVVNDFIGKMVKLKLKDTETSVEGELLKYNYDRLAIIKVNSKIMIYNNVVGIELGDEDIFGKPPHLQIEYSIKENLTNPQIEVSYITSDINWEMVYIIIIDKEFESIISMKAFAIVSNKSGKNYENIGISFIAGKANKLINYSSPRGSSYLERKVASPSASSLSQSSPSEQFISEYSEFNANKETLNQLPNNGTIEFDMFSIYNVKCDKIYEYFIDQYSSSQKDKLIRYGIEFKNEGTTPEGSVTVYQENNGDVLGLFLAQTSISTKAKNSLIKLRLGDSIKIVGSHELTITSDTKGTRTEKSNIIIKGSFERREEKKRDKTGAKEDIRIRVLYPIYSAKLEKMEILVDGKKGGDLMPREESNIRADITIPKKRDKVEYELRFEIRYLE